MKSPSIPGLTAQELEIVSSILSNAKRALIFGSRAKGTHLKFSDLDIAIDLAEKDGDTEISNIREKFLNSKLPFKVDLVEMNEVSDDFKKLILDSSIELKCQH